MIDSVLIEHFRGFTRLELNGLQRVNLIVGRNDVGKTSLLEALALLCSPETLIQQLPGLFRPVAGDNDRRFYAWLMSDGFRGRSNLQIRTRSGQRPPRGRREIVLTRPGREPPEAGVKPLYAGAGVALYAGGSHGPGRCTCLPLRMVEPAELVQVFSRAMKQRNGEELMEQVLRRVDDRVRKVRTDVAEDGNLIVVDLGLSEMLPLAQAGHGLYRLVSILAPLIGERPDVALIDEVDDGTHHSVLKDLWTGIAEAAAMADMQVFATTHSYECIEAAHEAFSERRDYGLGVIQLFRTRPGIEGRVLDREHIAAGIEGGIDLR